jgi:hypothetical protein
MTIRDTIPVVTSNAAFQIRQMNHQPTPIHTNQIRTPQCRITLSCLIRGLRNTAMIGNDSL